MKLKAVFILFISLILLTGCGNSNTKTLTCTSNEKLNGKEVKVTVKLKIKDNELKDTKLDIDSKMPKDQRKSFINMYRQYYNKMSISETSDGIRLSGELNSSFFKALGLSNSVSYSETKGLMELQGYTCK